MSIVRINPVDCETYVDNLLLIIKILNLVERVGGRLMGFRVKP